MDIEGLGEERVHQLVDAGLIQDAGDLYSVTPRAAGRARAHGRDLGPQPAERHRGVEAAAAGARARRARASATSGRPRRARSRVALGHLDRIADATDEELDAVDGVGSGHRAEHRGVVHRPDQPRADREAARRRREPHRAGAGRGPDRGADAHRPHLRAHRRARGLHPRRGGGRGHRAGRQDHRQRVEEDELRGRGRESGFEAGAGRGARRDPARRGRLRAPARRRTTARAGAGAQAGEGTRPSPRRRPPKSQPRRTDGRRERSRHDRRAVRDDGRAGQDPRVRPRHHVGEPGVPGRSRRRRSSRRSSPR